MQRLETDTGCAHAQLSEMDSTAFALLTSLTMTGKAQIEDASLRWR